MSSNSKKGALAVASTNETDSGQSDAKNAKKDHSVELDKISSYVDEAFDAVPEIGSGNRWYDYPYKVLTWFLRSRLGRALPYRIREQINYLCNYLIPWNEVDRERAWSTDDPSANLTVPPDEHVLIPRVWAVEFFPPSELDSLKRAIDKNGWDSKRVRYGIREPNEDMLDRSRKGAGWAWWDLGSVLSETANMFDPDAQKRKLPEAIEHVELTALQVGPSLTVVVGSFTLSQKARKSVDEVWRSAHEPKLYFRRRGRPGVRNRLWSAFHETQTSRRNLHDAVRGWMTDHCPGSFAHGGADQPLVDLVLLEKYEPTRGRRRDRDLHEALRAIGIMEPSYEMTSEDFPGLLLEPADELMCPAIKGRYTKTLWGQVDRIAEGIGEKLSFYGGKYDRVAAIGSFVDRRINNFLVNLAMLDFLQLKRAQHAVLRDQARARHGKFKRRDLQNLRDSFLTTSLDTNSVARDIAKVSQSYHPNRDGAVFIRRPAAWLQESYEKDGSTAPAPVNINEELRKSQEEHIKELVEFDKDYRSILSTVASIGSSIDAFKVQRYAIWIAFVSLLVAFVSLLATAAGPNGLRSFSQALSSWLS
ncbi:hypothetical protein ACLQ3D_05810 [Micromonospora vinacea]|uniref:hypothetical protein n=1 Tax=Micromonospora vinacea TaxID=709878 RepID=UPI003CEC46B6